MEIYRHVNYNDRLYWTVTGDHRQYMNGELSQETVLANISEGIEEKKRCWSKISSAEIRRVLTKKKQQSRFRMIVRLP